MLFQISKNKPDSQLRANYIYKRAENEIPVGIELRTSFIDSSQITVYNLEFSPPARGASSIQTFFENQFGALRISKMFVGNMKNLSQKYTYKGKFKKGSEIIIGGAHYRVVDFNNFPKSILLCDGHFNYYLENGKKIRRTSIDTKLSPPINDLLNVNVKIIKNGENTQITFFEQGPLKSGKGFNENESVVLNFTSTTISFSSRKNKDGDKEFYWKVVPVERKYSDYHDDYLIKAYGSTNVNDISIGAPYPNPLLRGDIISIPIQLPFKAYNLQLILYDESGAEVKRVKPISNVSNSFDVMFHVNDLPNGSYFAVLSIAYYDEDHNWGETILTNRAGTSPVGKIIISNK